DECVVLEASIEVRASAPRRSVEPAVRSTERAEHVFGGALGRLEVAPIAEHAFGAPRRARASSSRATTRALGGSRRALARLPPHFACARERSFPPSFPPPSHRRKTRNVRQRRGRAALGFRRVPKRKTSLPPPRCPRPSPSSSRRPSPASRAPRSRASRWRLGGIPAHP